MTRTARIFMAGLAAAAALGAAAGAERSSSADAALATEAFSGARHHAATAVASSRKPLRGGNTASGMTRPRPPARGVALGSFVALPGTSPREGVAVRERQLGRRLRMVNRYYEWADPFPGRLERLDVGSGRTPVITWWGTSLSRIVSGSQDGLIRRRAAAVRRFGAPVFIRWGAEMNGDWYAWSGAANGADPSRYVAAWRRIHRIFMRAGARNVSWVWAPNANSRPGGLDTGSWNNWRRYYPGDRFVDWVGIDGYNWGSHHSWQSFGEIFTPVYRDYAGRKPIMIAETGSTEDGGPKAAWISGARTWIKRHPSVRAMLWFDTNLSSTQIDWRIDSSSAALSAYRNLARDPYFSAALR